MPLWPVQLPSSGGLLQIQLSGTGPQSQRGDREGAGILLSAESDTLSFPVKIPIFQEERLSHQEASVPAAKAR